MSPWAPLLSTCSLPNWWCFERLWDLLELGASSNRSWQAGLWRLQSNLWFRVCRNSCSPPTIMMFCSKQRSSDPNTHRLKLLTRGLKWVLPPSGCFHEGVLTLQPCKSKRNKILTTSNLRWRFTKSGFPRRHRAERGQRCETVKELLSLCSYFSLFPVVFI